jgi:hypothetical protein
MRGGSVAVSLDCDCERVFVAALLLAAGANVAMLLAAGANVAMLLAAGANVAMLLAAPGCTCSMLFLQMSPSSRSKFMANPVGAFFADFIGQFRAKFDLDDDAMVHHLIEALTTAPTIPEAVPLPSPLMAANDSAGALTPNPFSCRLILQLSYSLQLAAAPH